MSDITVGVIGIAVLMVLFLIRVPVAFSMAIVGFAGFAYLSGPQAGMSILAGMSSSNSPPTPELYPDVYTHGCFAFHSGISKSFMIPPMPGWTCTGWADYGYRACLCGVWRHLRVVGGHGGDHGKDCHSGDEEVSLR